MKKVLLALVAIVAIGIAVPVAFAANDYNGTASLVSIGPNVAACSGPSGGPFAGTDSGVVNVHFNVVQSREKVNVSVHDALPNTTYVVDVRCVGQIGTLTTNSQGTGTAQIDLSNVTSPPGTFYIDIAVPPPGGAGAGGYGDTRIAGPFTLG